METEAVVVERAEILFSVQGHRQPFAEQVDRRITVAAFGVMAAEVGAIEEVVEVFLEDADEPLEGALVLIERLSVAFTPLHVARHHAKIAVTVEFNARDIKREFRPNATVDRVIKWATGPDGFNLEGDPSDFQLKLGDEVLAPDTHLGQIPHPHHAEKFDLVFKIKPQGDE
jgi:hypothetical protein